MIVSLSRVILFVQDVPRLAEFYQSMLGLMVVEEIAGEWVVLAAGGGCELALHRVGEPYRVSDTRSWRVESNMKLVMTVDEGLEGLRARLLAAGVEMRDLRASPGAGWRCDGVDPEGNVFQLVERAAAAQPGS
jgi:catechol 2,3-dioxygenase-like lactoylglutathione lyase family enzyme